MSIWVDTGNLVTAFIVHGDCEVHNNCVSSNGYPYGYGNNEVCIITMNANASMTAGEDFEVEHGYDFLYINELNVWESTHIPDVILSGQTIAWTSDYSYTFQGWQICFTTYIQPAHIHIQPGKVLTKKNKKSFVLKFPYACW